MKVQNIKYSYFPAKQKNQLAQHTIGDVEAEILSICNMKTKKFDRMLTLIQKASAVPQLTNDVNIASC